MVWLRIDDQIAHHPKFIEAGPIASWLWICGNAHCNKYLTDGFIQASTLARLGAVTNAKKWAERLVESGLWDRVEGGYQVHDFHDFNPTAAQVRERREAERVTKSKAGRAGGVKSGESRRRSIEAETKQNGSRHEADAASGSEAPSRPVPSVSDPIPQTPSARVAIRPARLSEAPNAELSQRAADFLETYGELYGKHRHGARILRRQPALDWDRACELCRTWPDARLVKMAEIFLTTDDDWITKTDRGFAVFVAKATWCDERLAAWEAARKVWA